MAPIKRVLRVLFARAEALFDLAFGRADNPLTWLGALGWYFFWIVTATGVYLYIFFDTGITQAYASVEYITEDQWYAAGIMRSLHRYASDALVIVVVLHIVREFALDRLRGRRFFAWITGVPLLWFLYVCGISGYWLVWDQLAQYIAIATSEWLDALPMFSEPIANNFLNSNTLGNRFFTLMVFIHIFGPLFMLLLMWVHIQRHARARVNPPKSLAIGTGVALTALSIVFPAVSQPPADLDVVPTIVNFDWYYLVAYPLLEVIPGGKLWLILIGLTILLAVLPWLPPLKLPAVAVVDLDNCNGCARCFDDCPFSAITMEPRSDGASYDLEAVVNLKNCVSCGACVGACPTATPFRRVRAVIPGIELPDHPIAALREKTIAASTEFTDEPRILVYACEQCGDAIAKGAGTRVLTMPCVSMLPPPFIDFALSRKLADGVVVAGCGERDCYYRLGDEWVRQRVAGERDPNLRKRVPRERLRLSWRAPEAPREREIQAFRNVLRDLGREDNDA
jgi:ferredoxin